MHFRNQGALITGGGRGIGAAIALRLAEQGCDIALNFRSALAEAEEVAGRIRSLGRRAVLLQTDLSEPGAPERVVEQASAELGRIDVLVNNAGIVCDDLLMNLSVEDIEVVLRTNLLVPMLCTRAIAPIMMRQRYGRIINISSAAASKPGRGQSNYVAAKGGLEAFTRAMAVELASRGVLVNAVAPGVIRTTMSQRIRDQGHDQIMAKLLLKRYGEPEEVADAVVFLASTNNRYMTGEVLHLDGGLKME